MTKQRLAKIKELERENVPLKQLLAEEKIDGKLKRRVAKKEVSKGEKKILVMEHIVFGNEK